MLRGNEREGLHAEGFRQAEEEAHSQRPSPTICLRAEPRQPAAPASLQDYKLIGGGRGGEKTYPVFQGLLGMSPLQSPPVPGRQANAEGTPHGPSPESSPQSCSLGSSSSASTGPHCGGRARN